MISWLKKLPKDRLAILAGTAWALLGYALLGGIRFSPEDQVVSFGPLAIAILYFLFLRLKKNPESDQTTRD